MIATVLGWIGTAGTLGAYLMLSRGRLAANSTTYALLNVVGGLLVGAASAAYGAWPSATANLAWAAISMRTLAATMSTSDAVAVAARRWLLWRERLQQGPAPVPVRSPVSHL